MPTFGGRRRRTKLQRSPKIQGIEFNSLLYDNPHDLVNRTIIKETFHLTDPKSFRKYIDSRIAYHDLGKDHYSDLYELFVAARTAPRTIVKKHVVVFVPRFKDPKNTRSPARCISNIVFVDNRVPKQFQKIIIDHEIRELLLTQAGYSPFRRAHQIALRREHPYLTRTGALDRFMLWLKEKYPEAYAERVKAWKYKMPQAK